jgi:hypothetical protein
MAATQGRTYYKKEDFIFQYVVCGPVQELKEVSACSQIGS